MTLLVLSDCHGDRLCVRRALELTKPSAALFLGDGADDFVSEMEGRKGADWFAVAGNCDYSSLLPRQLVLELEGVRLLVCHGDRYRVKSGLLALKYAAAEKGVQAALFGHTHAPFCESSGGVTLINPGSCRPDFGGSCALLEIKNGGFDCRLLHI